MYHAACKVEFRPFKRLYSQLTFFNFLPQNFRWPLVCSFTSVKKKFRIVIFLCRNRFQDTMLYMAAVAKTAATSKFDLSGRPLSAQRAFMANTREARANLMSRFVLSNVRWVRSTFDDYRYILPGATFTSYAINSIVWHQVPRVNQTFIWYGIRTYQVHASTWLIHLIRDTPTSTFRYTLSKSSESSIGLLDRAQVYAAPIRVPWRAIHYDYAFRSSTTYNHF